MKNKVALAMLFLLLCGCVAIAAVQDLGKVNIPTAVKLKGVLIQPGTYTVNVEKSGEDLMILLKRDGQVVTSEIAITKPAERHYDTARILYQPLRQDKGANPMSRVFCSYKGTLYLLYFDKP